MKLLSAVALTLLTLSMQAGAIELVERPTRGTQYETLRFRFAENLHFQNPFDLETNRVELLVQEPDFSRRRLSFFYDGLRKDSVEQWEARYAPRQAGVHRFGVSINGKVQAEFELPVSPDKKAKQGGLTLAHRPGVFRYESGEAFRGIGMNLCWAEDYEYYFKKMQASGVNVTRIWMCPWNLSFEWQETGLGRYNLASARRLDTILDLADRYGIFVILCMDYHGVAPKGMGYFKENRWLVNPYNKANGGPCADAADLFVNPVAKEFLKKKYKYIVSRFGHSPRIAAWEFYNEADLMAGHAIPISRWHVEMAEYVKSVDAHERLVSSSGTRNYVEKMVDAFRNPALDFVMYHDYNSLDIAPHFTDLLEATVEYYQKPVVLAEFGVEYRGGDRTFAVDSLYIGFHNGIWSGLFAETPVIPMSWWWDSYIDPHDLWREYASLSRFARSLDFDAAHLQFKTITAGHSQADPKEQVMCMVRGIYAGADCALWFKNDDYRWSLSSEGKTLKVTGPFVQDIPGLAPGRYTVSWYDPHTGQFVGKAAEMEVKGDGVLTLEVGSIERDTACLVKHRDEEKTN